MLFWIILVLLFVVAMVAYGAGVKKEVAWGKPVFVVAVALLVIVVVFRATGRRVRVSGAPDLRSLPGMNTSVFQQASELLGKGLKPHVRAGCRILLLSRVTYPTGRYEAIVKPALSAGLEDQTWQVARVVGPTGIAEVREYVVDAATLSRATEGLEGQIDAVVSLGGLPQDLEAAPIYQWVDPPAVAAFFPAFAKPDLGLIRIWLQKGQLQAAVVEEEGKFALYTPEKLP